MRENALNMKQTMTTVGNWLQEDIRRAGVLISIILSIWAIFTNDTINSDGILYIDAAYQITLGNFKAAYDLYFWPFFPALIALTSKLTLLDVSVAVQLINIVTYAAIVWLFISVLKAMDANREILLAGLVIIIVHPYVNVDRGDILRGPIFWALLLLATLLLIRIKNNATFINGLWLGLCLSAAFLFRVEAIAYIALGPLIILSFRGCSISQRLKALTGSYAAPLISGIGIVIFFVLYDYGGFSGRLMEPVQIIKELYTSVSTTINKKSQVLSELVLNDLSDKFSTLGIYAILLSIFIVTLIKRITIFYAVLAIYGYIKQATNNKEIKHSDIFLWFAAINIIYLLLFVVARFYLSSRFAMPASIFLSFFAVYGLYYLYGHIKKNSFPGILTSITAIILLIMFIDGVYSFGKSKRHIQEAGIWLKHNSDSRESILANHLAVNYYSGRHYLLEQRNEQLNFSIKLHKGIIDTSAINRFDYLAIRTKGLATETVEELGRIMKSEPLVTFTPNDKDSLVVYRVPRGK